MYTLKPASARFAAGANDAEHFVCIRFSPDLNRWIYAGDGGAFANQPFTLESADFVLAQFEFGNATPTLSFINSILSGPSTLPSFRAMRSGYISGDITIKSDSYDGIVDIGEFQIFGSYLMVDPDTVDAETVLYNIHDLHTYYLIDSFDRSRLQWNDTSGNGLHSLSPDLQSISYPQNLNSLNSTVCVASTWDENITLGISCAIFAAGAMEASTQSDCPTSDNLVTCWDNLGPQSNCLACDACQVLGHGRSIISIGRWNRSLSTEEREMIISVMTVQYYRRATSDVSARSDLAYSNIPNIESLPTIIRGLGFSTFDATADASIGFSACETTLWHADSSVSCHQSAGVKHSLLAVATCGVYLGSISQFWTYDTVVSRLFTPPLPRVNLPSTGSTSLTVYGRGLGLGSHSQSGSFGFAMTGCEVSSVALRHVPDVKAVQAKSASFRFAISVGIVAGSFSDVFSVDLSSLSRPSQINKASGVAFSIALFGQRIGAIDNTIRLVISETASEMTLWESDTRLQARFSQIIGGSRRFSITAGNLIATLSSSMSMDGASVSMATVSNSAASASISIRLQGSNFGAINLSPTSAFGLTSSESTFWVSDTNINCKNSHSHYFTLRVKITAGRLGSSLTEVFSSNPAIISNFFHTNTASSSSIMITVQGLSFGLASRSPGISTGLTSCEATSWLSETSTRCLSSGVIGTSLRVTTTAGLLSGSVTEGFSADGLWKMSTSMLGNAFSTGSIGMTVVGIGIGLAQYSQVLQVGGSASERTYWQSDSSIRCQSSQGRMSSRMVAVTGGVSLG
eukprot:CAMPEP_0172203042 /NCGR_PEP_ID=MMETSP1050-20130122/31032_1 /TAXON_ID=233186 /ORGANISM="Cryptomonas curvata, Strain CCAP979/52" /LENGTH=798 /DNA_ID=CAMNT_0012881149 /DNA_START=1304 /DNA_END=3697 /DNA_ORIENTATION=-